MSNRVISRLMCMIICAVMFLGTCTLNVYAIDGTSSEPSAQQNENVSEGTGEGDSNENEPSQEEQIVLSAPVITATAGDAQIKLKWSAVPNAVSYEVYDVAKKKIIATGVTAKSFTVKKLKNNKKYYYKVRAVNGEVVSAWSNRVTVKPVIKVPGKVKNVKSELSNKAVKLTWSKVKNATAYRVYRWDDKKKKYKKIGETSKNYFTNKKLTSGKKYYYRVVAIRKSGGVTAAGTKSDKVTVTAKSYVTGDVHTMYYKVRLISIAKTYPSYKSKKATGKLSPGTQLTVLDRKGNMAKVKTSKGKVHWIYKSKYIYTSCIYTTKDYTKKAKTEFVNEKKYKSKTKYLVWISLYTQKVNVFKGSKGKWKLIKTFPCASGVASSRSPQGVYKIYKKKRYGPGYGYITYFQSKNSFHSKPLGTTAMGRPASHGCIRMNTNDVKYIYNLPMGTTVVSY